MQHQGFTYDEHMAATAVAALAAGTKRTRDDGDVVMTGCKVARTTEEQRRPVKRAPIVRVLKPAPFFYYKDWSCEPDKDPLIPLTVPGRVPSFPAKMHAILSRSDLREIVAWQPHGRSWKVLKPREFEIKVLPKYFEHAKFSSFVRQANGWGFRRITQGPDRNSYYHEKFLRGLPHLCKDMKRPGVAEKKTADPAHEPDLYEIGKLYPLPEKVEGDESILLQSTLQGGPRARVPIYPGTMGPLSAASLPRKTPPDDVPLPQPLKQTPMVVGGNSQYGAAVVGNAPGVAASGAGLPLPSFMGAHMSAPPPRSVLPSVGFSSLQATPPPGTHPSMTAAVLGASQFAAGFAAATAYSQHQFRNILDSLAQQQQQQQQNPYHYAPHPQQHQGHNPSELGLPPRG